MTESVPGGTDQALRCPVCSARLRGSRECGRCGADLTELMRVVVAGWRARRDGWAALARGDCGAAENAVERSSSWGDSRSARRLAWLAKVIGQRPARQ